MSETGAKRLAWGIASGSITLAVIAVGLGVFALTAGGAIPEMRLHQVFSPIFAISYSLIGAIVAARRPRNPVGWISVVIGFFYTLTLASTSYSMLDRSSVGNDSLAGANLALWVEQWVWFPPGMLPMTFLLLLFPDGRLPSRRWLPIAWAAGVGIVAATLVMAVIAAQNPGARLGMEDIDRVLGKRALDLLAITLVPLLVIGMAGSIAAPIARFRRSRGIERQQLKWMAYAGGVLIVGVMVGSAISSGLADNQVVSELGIVLSSAVQLGVVLAAAIAILKYRLYDIDILINRTLVYGLLTVLVVAVYVIVVVALGTAFRARGDLGISLFATGLVAVGFQPLRHRLQRGVNRLMYGERDEPYQALSRLGHRLEGIFAPGELLPTIVEAIAQALKLPYVAIALTAGDSFEIAAEHGAPVEQPLTLPLTYQSEVIGQLICGPRAPGEPFGPSEQLLLEDMAHQAGVAVHAARLTEELQRSRQRLVTAREEERRRLRRDLHDGLGPELAALNLKLEAARNLIEADPQAADSLLAELKSQVQDAIADIRRLVYELRPPALDELGLVSAVRETASTHNVSGGLRVEVEGPDSMPPLPAAVEVAAYRIAQEALHNVSRHAQADRCLVRFTLNDSLELEVRDDGVGLREPLRAGVGLTSMKERVAELGGTFVLGHASEGGTRVHARFPLNSEEQR